MNGEPKKTDMLYLFIIIYLTLFYLEGNKLNTADKFKTLGIAGVLQRPMRKITEMMKLLETETPHAHTQSQNKTGYTS